MDREKVIKGLEICTTRPCYCTDCPYKKDCVLDSQEVMEDALALLKEQDIKTYGRLYFISAEAVAKDKDKVEKELFVDIVKYLMENGVLVIHSENTVPGIQVTYGWKLKGQAVKWDV